jgi:hypothetical protein
MVDVDTLNQLTIAKPCPASWDAMTGDDRVRHCELCKLNVYNVAALTRDEAIGLIERSEGRACVRLFKRADGTVLTADCPVGVKAAWQRVGWVAASALGALLFASAAFSAVVMGKERASASTFEEAQVVAKAFVVKHFPDWMVPEAWRPKPKSKPVYVSMGSPGPAPLPSTRPRK